MRLPRLISNNFTEMLDNLLRLVRSPKEAHEIEKSLTKLFLSLAFGHRTFERALNDITNAIVDIVGLPTEEGDPIDLLIQDAMHIAQQISEYTDLMRTAQGRGGFTELLDSISPDPARFADQVPAISHAIISLLTHISQILGRTMSAFTDAVPLANTS